MSSSVGPEDDSLVIGELLLHLEELLWLEPLGVFLFQDEYRSVFHLAAVLWFSHKQFSIVYGCCALWTISLSMSVARRVATRSQGVPTHSNASRRNAFKAFAARLRYGFGLPPIDAYRRIFIGTLALIVPLGIGEYHGVVDAVLLPALLSAFMIGLCLRCFCSLQASQFAFFQRVGYEEREETPEAEVETPPASLRVNSKSTSEHHIVRRSPSAHPLLRPASDSDLGAFGLISKAVIFLNMPGWEHVRSEKGVAVSEMSVPWCRTKALQFKTYFPSCVSLDDVLSYFTDDDGVKPVEQLNVFKVEPLLTDYIRVRHTETFREIYTRYKSPFPGVTPRDLFTVTANMELRATAKSQLGFDDTPGRVYVIAAQDSPNKAPIDPGEDRIMASLVMFAMTFQECLVKERNCIHWTWAAAIDPNGSIPAFVVDMSSNEHEMKLRKVVEAVTAMSKARSSGVAAHLPD